MNTWVKKLLYAAEHGGVHLSPHECLLLAQFLKALNETLNDNVSERGNK